MKKKLKEASESYQDQGGETLYCFSHSLLIIELFLFSLIVEKETFLVPQNKITISLVPRKASIPLVIWCNLRPLSQLLDDLVNGVQSLMSPLSHRSGGIWGS